MPEQILKTEARLLYEEVEEAFVRHEDEVGRSEQQIARAGGGLVVARVLTGIMEYEGLLRPQVVMGKSEVPGKDGKTQVWYSHKPGDRRLIWGMNVSPNESVWHGAKAPNQQVPNENLRLVRYLIEANPQWDKATSEVIAQRMVHRIIAEYFS